MKQMKSSRNSLCLCALSIVLSVILLLGTTFAWFTDSVTNTNNRIAAGTLQVDLLMDQTGTGEYQSIADGQGDIFSEAAGNGILWEPGKTEIVYLAVRNTGSLAVCYSLLLDVTNGDIALSDALEYAVLDGKRAQDLTDVTTWKELISVAGVQTGTLSEGQVTIVSDKTLTGAAQGEQNETAFFALAVHMKEDAGNIYQNGSVSIDVGLIAKQTPAETDGFLNADYDVNAEYEDVTAEGQAAYQTESGGVWKSGDFSEALANVYEGGTIRLHEDITLTETLNIEKSVTINGAGQTITTSADNHGYLICIFNDAVLTLQNVRIDGGSTQGLTANRALIAVGTTTGSDVLSGTLLLEDGAVLCNNKNATTYGAGGGIALINGSVEMNGGTIENNQAYSGGAVAIVNRSENTFEMNGGIMKNNTVTSIRGEYGGGAVYQQTGRFILNDGTITENTAKYGGAVHFYTLMPVFEMNGGAIVKNTANYGGGFYVNQAKCITLSGGVISQNSASGYAGGLLIAPEVVLELSKDIQITQNTSAENASMLGNNLYLDGYVSDDGMVHMPEVYVAGDLSQADIGISTWLKPGQTGVGASLLIAQSDAQYSVAETDLNGLTSDDSRYQFTIENGTIVMKAA